MTKRMFAVLPLLCVLALAMGGNATTPSAASPAAPLLTAPIAPDVCAPADPEWGACRWYCGSKSYLTAAQCDANCAAECEVIC